MEAGCVIKLVTNAYISGIARIEYLEYRIFLTWLTCALLRFAYVECHTRVLVCDCFWKKYTVFNLGNLDDFKV